MSDDQQKPGPARSLRPVEPGDWVGIAANAASGRGNGLVAVEALALELHRRGMKARIAWTLDERRQLVAESTSDEQCRCLVAAGGDGTIAALVNELPQVPIAVMPAGTENLFAGHFRFARKPVRLAEAIATGKVAPLDLGEIEGRRFALMAGFGFDAEVVSRHHAVRISRTGAPRPTNRAAYVDPVLRASFSYQFPVLRLKLDSGEVLQGTTAFVFNLPRYALGLPFAPDALGDDGLLDVVVFRDGGPFRALHYLWLVLRGLHLKRSGIYHRQIRSVSIESDAPVPIQLDGDPGGILDPGAEASKSIRVLPVAVEVLVANPGSATKRKGGERSLVQSLT